MKNICILGATGSIGTQALDVIRNDENLSLFAVSANKSWDKIVDIIKEFNPQFVCLNDEEAFFKVKDFCETNEIKVNLVQGMEGLKKIASLKEVDIVLTSVVGMIGLEPTIEAIRAKKDIALANKETLVVAGELIIKEAEENNVKILPVDSEHGAIFQCLNGNLHKDLSKVLLTASGGPFRGRKLEDLKSVNVSDALKHPSWNMGRKISIDSATLMNKGLEVIEAHFLFDVPYEDIQVIIHPESIIHSMVEYKDGSVIAQLAKSDMRLPIQYALNYPERKEAVIDKLDFYTINKLTFEKPDMNTFKCLKLAYEAGKIGKLMPTIMNAANEACVELFLNEKIKFLDIQNIVEECMRKFDYNGQQQVNKIIHMDKEVKEYVVKTYGI